MFRADELLVALTRADIRFVIIGGIAVGVHGYVRATKDLDIVPDPDRGNLVRLAHLLADIDAEHVGLGDFSPDEFPFDPLDPDELDSGRQLTPEHEPESAGRGSCRIDHRHCRWHTTGRSGVPADGDSHDIYVGSAPKSGLRPRIAVAAL